MSDREVVVYCACPHEATAAKVAMQLRSHGLRRVRPLVGGMDAWAMAGHPVERYSGKTDFEESTPVDRVVCYCGSGVTACQNLVALEHLGLHGARLYPGSWSEWSSDPTRPIERS